MPGSTGELMGTIDSKGSPVVAYCDPFSDGGKKVYIGKRKDDGAVVDTFHYGDGKWLVSFVYTNDDKAVEGAGSSNQGKTNTEDKGGKPTEFHKKNGLW